MSGPGEIPLYHSGTGLLLVGVAVCTTGFLVFCCIDIFWLRKGLQRPLAGAGESWAQFSSETSQSYNSSL